MVASAEGSLSEENTDTQELAVDADTTQDGHEASQAPGSSALDDSAKAQDQTQSGDEGTDSKSDRSG